MQIPRRPRAPRSAVLRWIGFSMALDGERLPTDQVPRENVLPSDHLVVLRESAAQR